MRRARDGSDTNILPVMRSGEAMRKSPVSKDQGKEEMM